MSGLLSEVGPYPKAYPELAGTDWFARVTSIVQMVAKRKEA